MNIAELRRLRERGTQGKWKSRPSMHGSEYRYVQIGPAREPCYTTLELEPADADLIAAAVNALGPLLDIAEAAQEVLDIPSTQHVHRLSVAVVKFLEEPCSTHG